MVYGIAHYKLQILKCLSHEDEYCCSMLSYADISKAYTNEFNK